MRISIYLSLLLFFLSSATFGQTACSEGERQLIVSIVPDAFPNETTWEVTDAMGQILGAGASNSDTLCLPPENCLIFTIYDSFGDGICCGFGDGSYTLLLEDAAVAEGGAFEFSENVYLGCEEGTNCTAPFTVGTGTHLAEFEDSWYLFTPDESGSYLITTCGLGNTCNTTIWVYDYCTGLDWNDSNEAAVYYSDDACGELAEVNGLFVGGQSYYIRIGDAQDDCTQTPVSWSVTYQGPVSGCTDPEACNYDPVATINVPSQCIYPGDPLCPNGPDLVVLEDVFINSLQLTSIENEDNCFIEEGCVSGYGTRQIIRFTTRIENIGNQDYFIGTPPSSPDLANEQWEWDACHGHWHYEGYAEYVLFDENGVELPVGFKNGFCVLDLDCSAGGGTAKFNCGLQGISAGCGDIYGSSLSCQWIDITDVPAGQYIMVIRINWDFSPDALGNYELDHHNNWAQACVQISRDSVENTVSMELVDGCQPYVDCLGEIYGNAQPDCTGQCAGTRLRGDLNQDTIRASDDVLAYIAESLLDTLTAENCNDLNADGNISVVDAALILDCVIHANGIPSGHTHTPCQFPFNVFNHLDTVTLSTANLNVDESYFDVLLLNPYNNLAAFEFEVQGATISAVESLIPDYQAYLSFDESEILGVSFEEDVVEKNQIPIGFIRVFYSELTSDSVCISNITAMLNENLEETVTRIGACSGITTSVNEGYSTLLNIALIPNPFNNTATLTFNNPDAQVFQLDIMDATGRVLRQYSDIRSSAFGIKRDNMPAGIYFFRLSGPDGYSTGKMVVQ